MTSELLLSLSEAGSDGASTEKTAFSSGTNSTDGAFDLLWDDKKVVHKSKTDLFTLYDANGMTVDAMDNGL